MDTMPAPVVDPAVVMRLSWRRALEFGAGIAVVFALWLSLTPAFDPLELAEPMDYAAQPGSLLVDVGMVVAVWWAGAAVAARQRVALQPTGPRPGVGWSQVIEVTVVSSFLGQAVGLRLSSGRRLRLTLPIGGAWRRDRAFRAEFEWVRAYAIAHGAMLGPVRSRRVRTLLVSLIPFLAVAAAAGALTVRRGAIWPWSPLATAPPACVSLAPGLDLTWPPGQRHLIQDDRATCTWGAVAGDSPYLTASVTITAETRRNILSSAVSQANQTYRDDLDQYRNASLTRLTGVGDQAFIHTSGTDDVAEARVANILVVVHLTRRSDQTGSGAAEEILRHLVPQIRVE
jgi:hypothetical protein